jgi:hypothetical protein
MNNNDSILIKPETDIPELMRLNPLAAEQLKNIALQRQLVEAQAKIAELVQEKELVER